MKCTLTATLLALTLVDLVFAGEKQPLTLDDLWRECLVSEITPSPDARVAAYVVSTIDRKANDYRRHIWEVDLSGEERPRQLTRGDCQDTEPRYSPDGRWLAFISDRQGSRERVYLLPRSGGEPHAPFALDSDMSSPSWSPDSRRLCFLARPPQPKPTTDVRVISRYHYRMDGAGYQPEPEEQIYEGEILNGQALRLTENLHSISSPAYSPDGRKIIFSANLTPDPDSSYNTDFCAVLSGGGKLERLTNTPETEVSPRYSPDGNRIACVRSRRANDWYAMYDLWCLDADGDDAIDLTGATGLNVAETSYGSGDQVAPIWSEDGRFVYTLLQDGPNTGLYRCDAQGRSRPETQMVIQGQVEYPSLIRRDRMLLHGREFATAPTEVYVSTPEGRDPRRLTAHTDEWLKERILGTPESVPIRSADGVRIDGWLLTPAHSDPAKKFPMILTIHGGPIWFYGRAFNFEHQLLATQGYAVLYTNPRGSSGYGQPFADAIKADWGHLDYQDLMAAVDAAVGTGFIDPARLGVTGISYGGIMTNWIVGHTDRFAAAITEESLCNFESSFGTDDCQIDWESEYGLPWENGELYRRQSPLSYARDVRTPLLIIHGEDDFRTNIEQAEQWFITLKRLGKEVLFLRYPRESHEFRTTGEPLHRYDRTARVLEWWRSRLRPAEKP